MPDTAPISGPTTGGIQASGWVALRRVHTIGMVALRRVAEWPSGSWHGSIQASSRMALRQVLLFAESGYTGAARSALVLLVLSIAGVTTPSHILPAQEYFCCNSLFLIFHG